MVGVIKSQNLCKMITISWSIKEAVGGLLEPTLDFLVNRRATVRAMVFASVPELQNRTFSILGKRAVRSEANFTSSVLGPPRLKPRATVLSTAFAISGWEWPSIPAEYSETKSMYSLPSTEVTWQPFPDLSAIGNGS